MSEQDFNERDTIKQEDSPGCFGTILTLIVILVVVAIAFATIQNTELGNLFKRDATNKDIIVKSDNDFSLSINLEVTAKVDIDDLQITVEFLDDDGTVLTIKTKMQFFSFFVLREAFAENYVCCRTSEKKYSRQQKCNYFMQCIQSFDVNHVNFYQTSDKKQQT